MPGKGQGGGNGKPPKGDGPLSLNGNKKDNVLTGGPEDDSIWGRDGDDTLTGMGGGDFIHGGNQNDIVIGDSGTLGNPTAENPLTDGDDRLFGGDGDDALYGGGGDDELQGGDGFDILDGGSGYDIALYSADDYAITVTVEGDGFEVAFSQITQFDGTPGPTDLVGTPESALNIEGIVGTYYNDILNGADSRAFTLDGYVNVFNGYYGDDIINGGAGADWLEGHGDIDTIDGGGGDDMIAGGSGGDTLTGGSGGDTFIYRTTVDGGDTITDFDATEGDGFDLSAFQLGASVAGADPVDDGFVFVVNDNQLFIDLTGGGTGDLLQDDILLATGDFTGLDLETDVIV